jgi:hypothetical protein
LLSVAKELRRMKTMADEERFRRFAALHREAVRDDVLKLVRDEIGDSNWRPTGWIMGMGFQARVDEILRHRYQRCRNGSLPIAVAARLDQAEVEPVRSYEQTAICPLRGFFASG